MLVIVNHGMFVIFVYIGRNALKSDVFSYIRSTVQSILVKII